MPSTRLDRRGANGSLAQRVARVTATATAGGALFAAVLALVVADGLVRHEEDRRLGDTALAVLHEMTDEDADERSTVAEEARELRLVGVRVAAFEDGVPLAGDSALEFLPDHTCDGSLDTRRCAVGRGRYVVVAANLPRPDDPWRSARLLGSLLAVLAATIVGAASGGAIARRVVSPLTHLRNAVDAVRGGEPSRSDLGRDEGIDEVDALRAAITDLLRRLDTELSRSRRFSADAAHELRTPLTALRTELELLREATHDRPDIAEPLTRSIRRTAELSELIEPLLLLSRSPSTGLASAELVDLPGVVEDVIIELSDEANRRVVLAPPIGTCAIRGDSALLHSLVRNIIDNALKFSGHAAVDVAVEESDGWVHLDVVDRGPGIAAADRELAFEPFHRAPTARAEQPGHGIGLALVAHVAATHGATVRFLDVAKGAHLEVRFPSAASTDA